MAIFSQSCRAWVVINGKIYLVSGEQGMRTDIYDPKTNPWSEGPKLPQFVGATNCVAWN